MVTTTRFWKRFCGLFCPMLALIFCATITLVYRTSYWVNRWSKVVCWMYGTAIAVWLSVLGWVVVPVQRSSAARAHIPSDRKGARVRALMLHTVAHSKFKRNIRYTVVLNNCTQTLSKWSECLWRRSFQNCWSLTVCAFLGSNEKVNIFLQLLLSFVCINS